MSIFSLILFSIPHTKIVTKFSNRDGTRGSTPLSLWGGKFRIIFVDGSEKRERETRPENLNINYF